MSTLNGYGRSRTGRVGEILIWSCAALSVAAVHAGAVVLLLKEPELVAADEAPPAAIMIELAAEPEAVETEEELVTPDQVDAEEVKTAAIDPMPEPTMSLPEEPPPIPVPEPEPMPEPIAEPLPEPLPPEPVVEETPPEPEPPQEVAEQPPEPLPEPPPEPLPEPPPPEPIEEPVQEQLAALDNVEVPLPVLRPLPPPVFEEPKKPEPQKPEPKPEVKKKVTKKPQPTPPASQAAQKAKAQVKQSDRTAAQQTSSGGGSSVSPAKWQARLMAHLERRKRYPSDSRANREQGTAMVRFSIDNSGNVLSVSLSRSSGFPSLDAAVLDMVRRASPVPAPPPGANKTIVAPVRFSLR